MKIDICYLMVICVMLDIKSVVSIVVDFQKFMKELSVQIK